MAKQLVRNEFGVIGSTAWRHDGNRFGGSNRKGCVLLWSVASLTNLAVGETSTVMAAVMISGMVPPLAMALSSTVLGKGLYSKEEREAGKSAWVLGLSFISEGAIPFAAADPIRVLASVTVGSAITGALSMIFNCGIAVPHGGFFVFLIPGAVENVLLYVLALAIGTAISGFLVTAVKVMAQKKQAAKE